MRSGSIFTSLQCKLVRKKSDAILGRFVPIPPSYPFYPVSGYKLQ